MSGKETALPMPTACVSTTTSDQFLCRRTPLLRATRTATAYAVCAVVAAIGLVHAADGTGKDGAKPQAAGNAESPAKRPACMHCGATCGLEAICVCKPGTTKKPVTEYETKCDPICVAGCSGPPWARHRTGCTDCPPERCRCPGWVRDRKTLVKETKDEDVCVVERSVAYVCAGCSGTGRAGCCDAARSSGHQGRWWSAWWASFFR
jgi:hypothetical protein